MDVGGGIVVTNDDMLCEIIKRLPVKDVLRFMCVSRPWNHLINNPFFISSHLKFHKQSPPNDHSHAVLGITARNLDKPAENDQQFEHFRIDKTHKTTLEHITTPFPWTAKLNPRPEPRKWRPEFQEVTIVGHCNGLVCALDSQTIVADPDYIPKKKPPNEVYDLERYVICNPITRRFHILPESDIEVPDLTRRDNDRFEEWRYKELRGTCFGFVDDLVYKVVHVIYGIGQRSDNNVRHRKTYQSPRVELYDSSHGSWRKVLVDNPEYSYEHLHNGVYNSCDGCMYWFGKGYRKQKLYWTLLSFDLVSEKWHETLFPHKDTLWSDDKNHEESIFGEYGVCLGVEILGASVVMFVNDERNALVHSVWKMNKDDDSWTHMYRFCCCARPQGFCRDGGLLLKTSKWVIHNHNKYTMEMYEKMVLYDHNNIDEAFHGFTDIGFKLGSIVPNFVQSLVLLDGETKAVEDAV